MKVGHLNMRSLLPSFSELTDLILESDFEIFGLTETWLNETVAPKILNPANIAGYQLVRQDRTGRGGGAALYYKTSLNASEVLG